MYRLACRITAVLFVILFGVFLLAPGVYMALYGVPADAGGMFLGQRASPMFLGLALLLWLLRDQTVASVQKAVALAMITIFAGIAATGIWDFATGIANATILLAAAGELVVAGAFVIVLRQA